MAIVKLSQSVPVAAYSAPPKVEIAFRVLRDGEVSAGLKTIRMYLGWASISKLDAVFETVDGEYSAPQRFDLAMLLSTEWLVTGQDNAPPRRTRATYMTFNESGIIVYNISSGEGGQVGDPAQVDARVRVERVPSSREVVLLERPADGEWRIAGYGPTPGGSGEIDLRVVGGDVYALAVDDYGVQFVADLAVQVGQRIRPTQYTGWVYEITEAGQLPSVEPAWWAAVGENPSQPLGTARAVARRYFQPIALGPGPVEVI
jgi:hypothetical protein